MKILLINPPSEHTITTNVPKVVEEGVGYIPPLGLMYVAAYIEKNTNHQIKIIDCEVEGIDYSQLENVITRENPDIIGITALTFTLIDVMETLRIIKKVNPKIKTILGGPHVHIYPEETLKIKEVDFVVLGEGELPIINLLENINNLEALKNNKGIAFRLGEQIINNGREDFIQNLDELPFPARHLTVYKKYFSVLAKQSPVTTMFTSRGCPYKCIFCDRPHLGKMFRFRTAANVVDEMEKIIQMGIPEIFIYDDTFTVDRQRVIDICDEILKRNLKISWDVRARVNTVDLELLKKMQQAGCERIHFGVEAGTKKILEVLRKGITLDQAKAAFSMSQKVGIQTLAYFIIGSPTETKQDILETIKVAKKLKPDFAHFSIMTPFPATDLYRLGLENGILPKDYWQEFAQNPTKDFVPMLWEENLNREELVALLKKAYRSFYFRPSYIIKRLLKLTSWHEFKTKFKAGINLLFRV